MSFPESTEYPVYFQTYIKLVKEPDLIKAMEEQRQSFPSFFKNIPAEKLDYRYEENKWTIKEIIGHLIDCERVMNYRAMCFARNDKTELPGFDENKYAAISGSSDRSIESLLAEFDALRQSSIHLFESFNEQMFKRTGSANGNIISVKALGFINVGHPMHHLNVISERYL